LIEAKDPRTKPSPPPPPPPPLPLLPAFTSAAVRPGVSACKRGTDRREHWVESQEAKALRVVIQYISS